MYPLPCQRDHYYQGPSQDLTVTQGASYVVSGYIKLQNDLGASQNVELEMDFEFPGDWQPLLSDIHRSIYVTEMYLVCV